MQFSGQCGGSVGIDTNALPHFEVFHCSSAFQKLSQKRPESGCPQDVQSLACWSLICSYNQLGSLQRFSGGVTDLGSAVHT